jgi:hypothetical protein
MNQFAQTVRRGGGLDVYTSLLFVATVVLLAGIALLAVRNMAHSDRSGAGNGGPLTLIEGR